MYSTRERTHAHRTMADDVPADVKGRRLNEVIECFRRNVQLWNGDQMRVEYKMIIIKIKM